MDTTAIENEIAGLKKLIHIRYAFVFTLFFLAFGFIGDLLFSVVPGETTLMNFLKSYRWEKLLWMGGWWFGFELLARTFRKKQLYKKEKELMRLQNSST